MSQIPFPKRYFHAFILQTFMFRGRCLLKFSVSVLLGLMVSACVTGPNLTERTVSPGVIKYQQSQLGSVESVDEADSVVEANPDQISVTPDIELNDDPDLPLQDLDAETLEQLLLMSFASFQGDWSLASKSAINAAGRSKDFRVARMATLLALRGRDYDNAAKASSVWVTLKPNNVNAQNMNILALIGSAQLELAKIAIMSQLADQDIDDYIKQLAGLLVRQKNSETGFNIVEHMVEQYSESAQVMVSAAFVAAHFEKFDAAEKWVKRTLELRPGWDLAAQMNANLLRTQNKFDERAAFIDQFVREYPHSIAMRINHSAELASGKKFQAAYDVMLEVLKDAPKDVGALQYAAVLAEQLENNKKSGEYLATALGQEPQNDEIRWSLGRLAMMDEKYVTAERLFDDIQDESLYIRAQIQVANMRNETQGVKEAVNTLRALRPKTEADYIQIALTRHYLLMEAHEYDEAYGYVNETLVYLPDNLELLYARALVAAELRKVDVAEQDFRIIIKQQPEHANALNALGYTLADQTDRYEEAKILIVQALSLRPNDGHILDSMGWVSYRLKDFEAAIEFLQKAYEASPQAEVAAHLGEVLLESGERRKAVAVLRKSFAEESDNPILNKVIEQYDIDLIREAGSRVSLDDGLDKGK